MNKNEKELINSLQGDSYFGQILDGVIDLKNEWKYSDEDDLDVKGNETYDSQDEGDDDESGKDGKKSIIIRFFYPTTDFKCKTFRWVLMDQLSLLTLEMFLENMT